MQKPNIEAEVYRNKNVTEGKKKKLKSLIRVYSDIKINNYNRGWGKSKRIYRTSQNIKIINVFLELLLLETFPSLGFTVHLTSLGCHLT